MITLPAGVGLVLASASSRRADLLRVAGLDFEVRAADVDETPRPAEGPVAYVERLAAEKAAVAAGPSAVVVAADTTVDVDGDILGKPLDDAGVGRMLRLLSGRTHEVHTGVCVVSPGGTASTVVTTAVTFVDLTDEMIEWYVATGDGLDKAGAYGIQGAAGAFVERVDGSVTNVIGLPLAETLLMLRAVVGAGSAASG